MISRKKSGDSARACLRRRKKRPFSEGRGRGEEFAGLGLGLDGGDQLPQAGGVEGLANLPLCGEDGEAEVPQPETPVMPLTGLLSQIAETLAERARAEKKLKRKQICVRQHGIYLRIIALLEEDADANRAKQRIADEFGINRKMLQRDLDEIEEFLAQKNVLPRRRTDSLQNKNDAT